LVPPLSRVAFAGCSLHDYLNGHGYGTDDFGDERPDLWNALPLVQQDGVVVEPELADEEEGPTEDIRFRSFDKK
jgi:hypothetical protein